MNSPTQRVTKAIQQLQRGGMVVIADDPSRENEGDVVIAAEYATPEAINFIAQYARGVVCLSLQDQDLQRLQLDLQPQRSGNKTTARFTVSIDAAEGITTGVSVCDRAKTIATVLDPKSQPKDLCTPGHIFPLRAEPWGVLARRGHTEASVDLAKLAKLKPAAVICEIMNPDGSMTRGQALQTFAERQALPLLSVADIVQYRLTHESLVQRYAEAELPTNRWGTLTITVFRNPVDNAEIVALHRTDFVAAADTPVRLHSACLTGDLFNSLRCDCGNQLQQAMDYLMDHNGILLYLPQEGRGIGLGDKIRAYALQEQGMNTVEANLHLGFSADQRTYGWAAQVLKKLGLTQIQLLTNNPDKMQQLQQYGIEISQRIPVLSEPISHNATYLHTKKTQLNHWLT